MNSSSKGSWVPFVILLAIPLNRIDKCKGKRRETRSATRDYVSISEQPERFRDVFGDVFAKCSNFSRIKNLYGGFREVERRMRRWNSAIDMLNSFPDWIGTRYFGQFRSRGAPSSPALQAGKAKGEQNNKINKRRWLNRVTNSRQSRKWKIKS
jgi:hypothetical protein